VSATEVARAGHGAPVLLKIYARCIDGLATTANHRIADALGSQDAEEDPGDEDDGKPSRHSEMAGQRQEGPRGQRDRSHLARPWPFPRPSVARSASGRGPRSPEIRYSRTHDGPRQPGIAPRTAYAMVIGG
jgi:hypothetical protein